MSESTAVLSWVAIRRGCEIGYRVNEDDEADFQCGQDFELTFDTDALREFVRLGTEALHDLTARRELTRPERA